MTLFPCNSTSPHLITNLLFPLKVSLPLLFLWLSKRQRFVTGKPFPMELSYELLWTTCTAILLSFLVARLVSLILSCSNSTDQVTEKGFKLNPDFVDQVKHKKLLKSSINGGERLRKVQSCGSKKKKRVKFVDPVAKFAEFPSSDVAFVKDIEIVPSDGWKMVGVEVNVVDCGEFEGKSLVGIGRNGEKEEIKLRESDVVGKGLVDLREDGNILVGFDGVGDKIVGCDRFEGGEKNVEEKDRVVHDIDVILGSDEVVDDQNGENLKDFSYIYEDDRRVKQFASGENDVDCDDEIVGCDGFEGGEKNVHDIDVIWGSDEVVDDQKEENLKDFSNIYEEDRRGKEFASGENDVDCGGNIVVCDGFDGEKNVDEKDRVIHDIDVILGSSEVVNDQNKESLKNSSNKEFASGENVEEFEGAERVIDRQDQGIDLFLSKQEVVDDERDDEAKASSNVCRGERSCGEFDGEGMLIDEEEWEGIERSDLEKDFARAKGFVELDDKGGRLAMVGNDVMMQLYGLEKVAMEGPCHEPQPMALKFSARAKWNAWQRLGNMSPEEAMEQYITVLSENVPEWMEDHSSVENKSYSIEEKIHSLSDVHTSTSLDQQSGCANLRTSKLSDLADVSTSADQEKE